MALLVILLTIFLTTPTIRSSTYQQSSSITKGIVGGLTNLLNIVNKQAPLPKRVYAKKSVTPLEVLSGIQADFEQGYLFSGKIDSEIYSEECLFTDPTLSFRGLSTFERNIAAISPVLEKFIGDTTVILYSLQQDDSNTQVKAKWRMSGEIKLLPWNPRIELRGNTRYTYDPVENNGRIVDYYECWELDAGKALAQLLVAGPKRHSVKKVDVKSAISINVESTKDLLLSTIKSSVKSRNIVKSDMVLQQINSYINTLRTVYNLGPETHDWKDTEWRVLYTNSTGPSSGSLTKLLVGSEVTQTFGAEGNKDFFNSIFLLGRAVEIRLAGIITSATPNNAKINLSFEDIAVLFTGMVVFQQKNKGNGFWRTIYQDDTMRIFTTNAGSVFVTQKIKQRKKRI